jgi:hypothetical protein
MDRDRNEQSSAFVTVSRAGKLSPGENCCRCVRPTFLGCGYCGGYGVIEEGVDGQPAGPCHCCGPFDHNAIVEGIIAD